MIKKTIYSVIYPIEMDNFEEVKLFTMPSDREHFDNMADCYSLINTIERLEKAFIQNAVTDKEYTAACSKLLAQFKTAFKLVGKEFKVPEQFLRKYRFEASLALDRIKEGAPITIKGDKGKTHACISSIVSLIITICDRLKLGMKSVDELMPDFKDLHSTMVRLSKEDSRMMPPSYEGPTRISAWIEKMSTMSASDELDENQIRQMIYDMDTSFSEFNKILDEL